MFQAPCPVVREPLTLQQIAAAAGLSVFYLCRLFRRVSGATLRGYRTSLRLSRALDLLPEAPHDLLRAALEVGYSSHSHFTQAFKQRFGVTPSEAQKGLSKRQIEALRSSRISS